MKKMWKIKKDKSAVSPVIATILMVAITVVLAAVLYVMVMGFGGTQSSTPTGSFTITAGVTTGTVNFAQISPDTKYSDCKITVQDMAGTTVWVSAALTAGGSQAFSGVTALNSNPSGNGKISVGDTMALSGAVLASNKVFKVQLLYVPTGGVIASQTFTAG